MNNSEQVSESATLRLQRIFGFSTFRANQEEIVQAILAGRDIFAVMPTGGGKSLCYQLPASMMKGTCLVVSPLISLMKDQVDAANAFGMQAGLLNSTLSATQQHEVLARLQEGDYDLLYLSPERLATAGFFERLRRAPLSFVAVDEAHCISEWGHDFRPDYLALANLKQELPGVPITAFTATATQRVQEDIVRRLGLRQPLKTRASFDRPNLFYQVQPREQVNSQIEAVVVAHPDEAGIVYRLSRADVEKTAAWLQKRGVKALPYHAGLDKQTRGRNQEAFNRDEVQVVVATVAFGMGIDKSNVRFVIHGDLPKSMEGYYQETGRAGRDGEPALCLLLYSRGDYFRLRPFIDQLPDERERQLGQAQLSRMMALAEQPICRRRAILHYFDEEYGLDNCGACDVCVHGVQSINATIEAQMVMSAIYRSGQRFGAGHIVDIVYGARTARISTLGHDQLKTYGVGRDRGKRFWRQFIDGMLAQGLLKSEGDPYPMLQITAAGEEVLFGRAEFVSHQMLEETGTRSDEPSYDEQLFALLKKKRREMAEEAGVPPYVLFSDKSLHQMCNLFPQTPAALLAINGVGQVKCERYGRPFLEIIAMYAAENPEACARQTAKIQDTTPPPARKQTSGPTMDETLRLAETGMDVEAIAVERQLQPSTIASHIGELLQQGKGLDVDHYVDPAVRDEMTELFRVHGLSRLKPIVEGMEGRAGYQQAHIVRGFLLSQGWKMEAEENAGHQD
ncbi:MAG: DNA helicase RecQ [Desulfoarculaceae bacterium]|nr:DNA helicase RecQ [Desulfoarculaceae bacterium]